MTAKVPSRRGRFVRELVAEHQVAAGIWALGVAAIGFIGGTSINRFAGPQEVIVTNQRGFSDTLVVIDRGVVEAGRDTLLERLLAEVTALRSSRINTPAPTVIADQDPTATNLMLANSPTEHRFTLPEVVEGYAPYSLSSLASANCPGTVKRGSIVSLTFRLLHASTAGRASPYFVDVHQRRTPNSVLLLFSQQYDLREGWNRIDLAADFEPGAYELVQGLYLRSEVGQKYPPFYRLQCELVVVD